MIFTTFFLFLLINIVSGISGGQPVDKIALDCGSSTSETKAADKREWIGDVNPTFFPLLLGRNNASRSSKSFDQFTQGDDVPYATARLSHSEFIYTIPVAPGPKFIRMHFYNATYDNLDHSRAVFSVKVAQYVLLSNFNVYDTAYAVNKETIVKEFCAVIVEKSSLNIKFTPSSSISDAFAFVNGIEVVSMPPDLYYSKVEGHDLRLVEEKQSAATYPLRKDTALENIYRVNIGGSYISPASDTGMFRSWDSMGDEFLTVPGVHVLPYTNATINFKAIPNYTAPSEIYRSGVSIGNENATAILSYNLTWEFPVDPGFYYFVRLHFCEMQAEIKATGECVFRIFIVDQLAEDRADVFDWSGGIYSPYYRDYAVPMFAKGDEKKLNLSIALQAIGDYQISLYHNAYVNAIEIFKLNDTGGNLAGPNPDPIPATAPPPSSQERKKNKNQQATIGVVAGVVSGIVILSVLGFLIFQRRRRVKNTTFLNTTKSSNNHGSSLPSDLCRYFSFAEIQVATNNFEEIFIIGVGGFGHVYKGYINNGTIPVAIKRLKPESSQGAQEFKTEIEMLSHLRHRHLVSLIGYCNDNKEMILVYDYMARGTLRDHLYNTENPPLSWKQRLEICIGAARGLHYLHTGAKHTIIHRDVKTTNILLDEKWVANVSDFGLSKTGPTSISKAHVSTVVKGSVGYLDPEYYRRHQLTEKSDVYSFGVVLCEVVCARPPIVRTEEKGKVSLAEWFRSSYENETLHQIIDPHLKGKIAPECLKTYGEIAVKCLLDNGTERPSMSDVVWRLEFAMQLQQNAEENDKISGAIIESNGIDGMLPFMIDDNSVGAFTFSWDETTESKTSGMTKVSSSEQSSTANDSIKGMSGAVFSEINNQEPR